jgi:hypothetical protein
MNPNSAADFISAFLAMMAGNAYKRAQSEFNTRYLVDNIRADYGEAAYHTAIKACAEHASYYAALGRGRLAYVERIVEEARK